MPYQSASPWAVVLCKFADSSVEPFPREYYENLFTSAGTGRFNLVDFFREYSHGHIDIGGSEVFGWLGLPQTRSDYQGSGANPTGRQAGSAWVRTAATQAGIDLTQFYGVIGCMNVSTDLFGGPDRNVITPNGDVPNDMSPSMLAQEILHGYGAHHSHREGQGIYTDNWDAMSTANTFSSVGGPFYSIGPGLNAANMDYLGWLDPKRVWTSTGTSNEEIQLRPHHRRDLPGFLVARVGPYYVEYRAKQGWDAAIPRDAILVHRLDAGESYLMRGRSQTYDLSIGDIFEADTASVVYQVTVTGIDIMSSSATLQLTSSRKAPQVIVPNVIKEYYRKAAEIIKAAGLVPKEEKWEDGPKPVVEDQVPSPGGTADKGSTVVCYTRSDVSGK